MKVAVTVICVALTLLQGGFPDAVWALCGVLALIFLLAKAKKTPRLPVLLLMLSFLAVYLISAAVHGWPYESLAVLCKVTVAFLLFWAFINMETDAAQTLFAAGMAVALIGYAAFCGLLPWNGAVVSQRLQSVFEYANSAALFLGAAAFMTRNDPKRAAYAPFLETALLLTQSVGAIAVYAAGWGLRLLTHKETKAAPLFCGAGFSLLAAGSVYALVYVAGVPFLGALPPLLLLVFRKQIKRLSDTLAARKWVLFTGVGSCIMLPVMVFYSRGLRPLATAGERLTHMSDGLRVMTDNPLGIGPGRWAFESYALQSSDYTVTKIHSEIVSIGVDAGFLAVAAALLLLGIWLKGRAWDAHSICVVMILLGAAMDIPFSFCSIVFITALLSAKTSSKPLSIPPPARLFFLLPLVLCGLVFTQSVIKNQAERTMQPQLLEKLPVRNDTEAILSRMNMALDMGRHDKLDEAFASLKEPNAEAYAYLAQSLARRGEFEAAEAAAMRCIELSPHQAMGYDLLTYIPQIKNGGFYP
ncbi:MAG: O-antigen ligase family protein [Oscillospiraceae bacterium]|nr:O-antigen ligase family protein [Oscillospiraceae bacterium]